MESRARISQTSVSLRSSFDTVHVTTVAVLPLAPPAVEMSLLILPHILHKLHEESRMQRREGLAKAEDAHRFLDEGRDCLGQSRLCPVNGHRDTLCHWAPDCQEYTCTTRPAQHCPQARIDADDIHAPAFALSFVPPPPHVNSDIEPPPRRQHSFAIAAPNEEGSGQQCQ